MKKFLFLFTLMSAMPLCQAEVPSKQSDQVMAKQDDACIKEVEEQLAEYAELSFEEKRARALEICTYIGRLFDTLLETKNIKRSSGGSDINASHAAAVLELIKLYLPSITA